MTTTRWIETFISGGALHPRASPAGLAAGGYSVPGIGESLEGLNALESEKTRCAGTTPSSQHFDVLETSVGFTGGQPSDSVRCPADRRNPGREDRHW